MSDSAANGTMSDTSLAVDEMTPIVQQSPGASDINVSATTFELAGPDGTDRFPFTTATAVNRTRTLYDDDSSLNDGVGNDGLVLNSRTDRPVVALDTTALARNGTYANEPLEPDEEAALRIDAEGGATSIIRIRVPPLLSGEESVAP